MTDTVGEGRKRGRPREFGASPNEKVVQALDKGLTVLKVVAAAPGSSLSEIAERSDVSAPTAYRSLITMQTHGLVTFDDQTQLWRIAVETFRIGSTFLANTSVVEQARPVMQTLMETSGETVNLGIIADGHVVFLSQVETHQPIRAFFRPGTRSSIHAAGIGKALLAYRPAEDALKMASSLSFEMFTERTISDSNNLFEERRRILNRGFAVDDEERTLGMRCVAAPVFNSFGEATTAISISGPSVRMPKDAIAEIGKNVRAAADKITTNVGGRLNDFT